MLIRTAILRTVLVGVVAAAVAAVYAIFVPSTLAGQLVGSALVLIGGVLVLPFVPRQAGERLESFAALAIGYLVVAKILILVLIWSQSGTTLIEDVAMPWAFVGMPALLVVVAALRSRKRAAPALRLAESIAGWGAAASLVGTTALLSSAPGALGREGTYGFGYALLVATVLGALCAVAIREPARSALAGPPDAQPWERSLGIAGIALAAAAAIASYPAIAMSRAANELVSAWAVVSLLAALSASIAAWSYFGLAPANLAMRVLRTLATLATLLAGICSTYAVWLSTNLGPGPDEFAFRTSIAAGIVAAASCIAALVAMRMSRVGSSASEPIRRIDWKCPRCRAATELEPGEHCCRRCGLTTIIAFRDDRCPGCDYDLHAQDAGAAHCPECGRARQMPPAAAVTRA